MDTTVKLREGRYYAPGIGDDTRGLAVLLSVIDVMNQYDIKEVATLFLAALAKGRGDCESKALFRDLEGVTDSSQLMACASAVSPPVVPAVAASSSSRAPVDTPLEPSACPPRSTLWAGL